MNQQIFKFLLFFAAFGSLSCFEQYGSAKIGERCERDRNCIQHAYCRVQMTCLCNQYYSPTFDMSMCIASAGLSCTDDFACSTMANAECRQGVCACKDSYILDINNSSNCISKPSKMGDHCQRTDECQDALGRAMCINNRCQCISSYHFVNETAKCIQTRLLYNTCLMDYECRGFNNENVLECRNGECVCKEGEATCNKG
ncbi:hypothetical protein WH47_02883 [Habropoda laboriosa]|uniref:EB domain-containing protein n=2 Tax=Habropoda laboriosa TaxID=597456 RepID=A0A0L7RHP4_9HYME|nr:hypothetical protein WH47_02883 [Habropoda laboriosa]